MRTLESYSKYLKLKKIFIITFEGSLKEYTYVIWVIK